MQPQHLESITLRAAGVDDLPAIARLAELDSQPPLAGPALIAIVGGEVVAALSLAEDRAVANPFVHTAWVTALLRRRASELSAPATSAARPRRRPALARPLLRRS